MVFVTTPAAQLNCFLFSLPCFLFLSCLFLLFLSVLFVLFLFPFFFRFLLFSFLCFLFLFVFCFCFAYDLRLSSVCVVIDTTCNIYVVVVCLRWQAVFTVGFPAASNETYATGIDLAHRRLTPYFNFLCFWWRHELRQLCVIYQVYVYRLGLFVFFPRVFLSSRVTGACPVTTDLLCELM